MHGMSWAIAFERAKSRTCREGIRSRQGDAWRRHTIRGIHAARTGVSNRLDRGHRTLGRRRWDDLIQQVVNEREEMPWQTMAQSREGWAELEGTFVAKALGMPPAQVQALPPGCHMMPDTRRPSTDDDQWT